MRVTYYRPALLDKMIVKTPIKYVYYTECDQIVRYDSITFQALSKASNESVFFVSKRREKRLDSSAVAYMSHLDYWRECGESGYSITWPEESIVRHTGNGSLSNHHPTVDIAYKEVVTNEQSIFSFPLVAPLCFFIFFVIVFSLFFSFRSTTPHIRYYVGIVRAQYHSSTVQYYVM